MEEKEIPSVDEWIDLVYNSYVMETFNLRTQKDFFIENCMKQLIYVSNIRPDFV